jgi:Mg-chelatase subunit ChlD
MSAASLPAEFHYRARFPARSFVPGHHASRVRGGGLEVAALVPLERARDARRLDLRASLRDPFQGWWVREYHQRSSLHVLLLADVSASMAFTGRGDKRAAVLEFAQALRYSAARTGDAYGQVAFDAAPLLPLLLRPTRARHAAAAAVAALAAHAFTGPAATGLRAAAEQLPQQPSLVFLVSDFHFPVALLDATLALLPQHDVVPVWLRDPAEMEALPARGLVELSDAESGRTRTLWMRPALRQRWVARIHEHRQQVQACLARHQRMPLVMDERFDADRVTEYFT